jgi:hypothetical protein
MRESERVVSLRWAVTAFSLWNRRRKVALIKQFIARRGIRTAVFVGGGVGSTQRNESIIERAISEDTMVMALLDVALIVAPPWPGVIGDGRALPWRAQAVDLVLANAVIEHVGGEEDQQRFMSEQARVGRSWVVTTPNRWFPVESHTAVILRHWSPRWRARRSEFTRLLSLREFRALLPPGASIAGRWWSPTFVAFSASER